jgi:hypothetical protein
VALEVARALTLPDVHVIPVLVGDANLPKAHELPESLAALARRQAIQLSDSRWTFDVDRLVQALSAIGLQRRKVAWLLLYPAAGIGLLLMVAALVWNLQRDRSKPDGQDGTAVASIEKSASAAAVAPTVTSMTTTSTEGSNSLSQSDTAPTVPVDESRPAATPMRASQPDAQASSAPARLSLSGLWTGEFARFSDNSRRREVIRLKVDGSAVFGESWQETWHDGASEPRLYRKFSFGSGKLEGRTVSFCVPIALTVGNDVEKYRNCYVGTVRGDAIAFRVTYQVDHPTDVPEYGQFVARMLK